MADLNGAIQKLKITPASMAEAIGLGIDDTNRPSAGHSPVKSSSAPVTINAPTALEKESPMDPEAISKAAPGVLQTMLIGILYLVLRSIDRSP